MDMMDFNLFTQQMWQTYFADLNEDGSHPIQNFIDPTCTIIGTGKHEIYQTAREFQTAMYEEFSERNNIQFQFRDFWCDSVFLSEDLCLVYGEIYIYWESEDKETTIDMDSRFSIVYRRREDEWKIIHIHHSLPNIEQTDGEYYPKTLLNQFNEEMVKMEYLRTLAERDGLTGLVNYRTFQERCKHYVDANPSCWLFIIDVDKFKEINDTFGHMSGNRVLKKMAMTLNNMVRSSDIVCRMGGDEFVLLCSGIANEEQAHTFTQRIKKAMADAGKGEKAWTSISIGKARLSAADKLEDIIEAADADLYHDKKNNRQPPVSADLVER